MTFTTRSALKPLLKWTGGKRSEIPFLKAAYPQEVKRIIEPFSGGAAVAFDLNPDSIVLNDLNEGLVSFYHTMQSEKTRIPMFAAIECLDVVRKRIAVDTRALSEPQVADCFVDPVPWVSGKLPSWTEGLPAEIAGLVSTEVFTQLTSKVIKRIPALEAKRNEKFSTDQRREHLETGIQAGVYTAMRYLYNGQGPAVSQAWSTAAWWFVRALCYSGMFRYGKNGRFNVPYGGIGYNGRDFSSSLAQLRSPEVSSFFSRSSIYALDFDELFKRHDYFGPGDFIFVDPPYDSAFSKYNLEADFGQDDQRRLAQTLKATSAPWMLVIKNTPFILSLYQDEGLFRGVFGKQYKVNFRNRHDRSVEHLVVTNYSFEYVAPGEVGILPEQ